MSEALLANALDFVLAEALRRGATAADAAASRTDSLSVAVRLGEVDRIKRSRSQGVSLRVFVGRRGAVVSSADLDRDSLQTLVEQGVALARVTAEDRWAGLPDAADLASDVPDLDLFDPEALDLDPGRAVALCRRAESAAREADGRIRNSDGARFRGGWTEFIYGATNGFRSGYRGSSFALSVVPVAAADGEMQRDYWYTSARKLGDLDEPEAVGREAARRALRRLGARKTETVRVPVVFEPEAASGLLGQVASAVSGGAVYRKMSFLAEKLGEEIASKMVTIVDDGRLPRGLASKPFDGEGVATRRTVVVEQGVLRSYLLDVYSARRLGLRTTGNAARGAGEGPYAAPTNLVLEPGTRSHEEIVRDTGTGFLVTETMGFGVNLVTGDYSQGAAGLWIEGGAPTHAVQEVTIAGNLREMLRSIDAVGSDLHAGRSIAAPTLRVACMTVAGR